MKPIQYGFSRLFSIKSIRVISFCDVLKRILYCFGRVRLSEIQQSNNMIIQKVLTNLRNDLLSADPSSKSRSYIKKISIISPKKNSGWSDRV